MEAKINSGKYDGKQNVLRLHSLNLFPNEIHINYKGKDSTFMMEQLYRHYLWWVELHSPSSNSYVEVLGPSTSEHDFIWK